MLENIEVLCHSSIRIKEGKVIYVDPFKIEEKYNDADIIFITHSHYDHYSEEDIGKVKKDNTSIVAPKGLVDRLLKLGFENENIIEVVPNNNYSVKGIYFETVSAYNLQKNFHPKASEWVGYVITINQLKYYIAGDTDITPENKKVKCDIALVPVGGTYTMNSQEAAELINKIRPKIAIPIHYGSIVGRKEDAIEFSKLLNSKIKCEILIT